jgi:phage-related protein
VAFALFGVGASLTAKAFEVLAKAGMAGLEVLKAALEMIIDIIPEFLESLAEGAIKFAQVFLDAAPVLIASLQVVLSHILDTIVELGPQLIDTVVLLIEELLAGIREIFPDIVETGYEMLLALMNGLSENIEEITNLAIDIVVSFIGAITDRVDEVVTAGIDFLVAFISGIADNLNKVTEAVGDLVVAYIDGIAGAYLDIIAAGAKMVADILAGIASAAVDIVAAGAQAIISFLEGVASNVLLVIDAGFQIVIDFLNGFADSIEKNRGELAAAGFRLLDAISGGILGKAVELFAWFAALPGAILSRIVGFADTFAEKGKELIRGIWTGIVQRWADVRDWFSGLDDLILEKIGDLGSLLLEVGKDIVRGLWEGISSLGGWLWTNVSNFVEDKVMRPWSLIPGVDSPAKELIKIGEYIVEGLGIGIISKGNYIEGVTTNMAQRVVDGLTVDPKSMTNALTSAITNALSSIEDMGEFNPVITPVIDLTKVQRDARVVNSLFDSQGISVDGAYGQASLISATNEANRAESMAATAESLGPREIKFEQINNSPESLSTIDIYRNTKSLLTLAKEELEIA